MQRVVYSDTCALSILTVVLVAAYLVLHPTDAFALSIPGFSSGMDDDPGQKILNWTQIAVKTVAMTVTGLAGITLAVIIAMAAAGKLVPKPAVYALLALVAISALAWIINSVVSA